MSQPLPSPAISVSGRYRRSPLAGTFYPAELASVPMSRPQEYAQGRLLEHRAEVPVLMSPSQRNHILAELVRGLREHVPGLSCVLVRLYGPDFNVQLPKDLLAPDVLLVHDPLEALGTVLDGERCNVALIRQDLRADGQERGGNRLTLSLVRHRLDAGQLERFRAWIGQCRLLTALEEQRIVVSPELLQP